MTPTILVCDDDEGVADISRIVLEEKGYKVEVCQNSDSIIETVNIIHPALILLDLWMPGMGGEQAAIELKGNKKTKNIPIIICSASKDSKKIAQYSGAEAFLAKPFDIDTLEDMVEKYIKAH